MHTSFSIFTPPLTTKEPESISGVVPLLDTTVSLFSIITCPSAFVLKVIFLSSVSVSNFISPFEVIELKVEPYISIVWSPLIVSFTLPDTINVLVPVIFSVALPVTNTVESPVTFTVKLFLIFIVLFLS